MYPGGNQISNHIPFVGKTANQSQERIFCYAPWSNLEILPQGSILPCCKFQDQYYDKVYNVTNSNLTDYFSSKLLDTVKKDFEQNRWPTGCERCRIEEESNIPSKRQLDYERWKEHYLDYEMSSAKLLTISLALGNTCNLKCIMCSPTASSFWSKEYHDIYGKKITPITQFRKIIINDLLKNIDDVIHIDIHGGEPFLSKQNEHIKLLNYFLKTKKTKNVSIHYTTNGIVWPDNALIELWKNFREIDLQISIDGVKTRYEYIRYPASWSILEDHVEKYLGHQSREKNFRISVSHTVNAYNILYLDEFFSWCESVGLSKPWTGKLHKPKHLRPTVWPDRAKQMIISQLYSSDKQEIKNWASHLQSHNDTEWFSDFVKFTKTHDQYRNLDFRLVFPELASYI